MPITNIIRRAFTKTKSKCIEATETSYLLDVSQLGLRVKTIQIGFKMVFATIMAFVAVILFAISFLVMGYSKIEELHSKLEDKIRDSGRSNADAKEKPIIPEASDKHPSVRPEWANHDKAGNYFSSKVNTLLYVFKQENEIHNINQLDLTKGDNLKKVIALNRIVADMYLEEFANIEKLAHVDSFYGKEIIEAALMEQVKYGIPASITLAQAAQESQYGQSRLAMEANNLFGIKWNKGDRQEFITYYTHEEFREKDFLWLKKSGKDYELVRTFTYKGSTYYRVKIVSKFRKYGSWWHSIRDHSEFLAKRPGYQKLFANNGNWRQWVRMFRPKKLGGVPYATSTSKSVTLGKIIERYRLYLLDVY